jgi:hypothetical protein
MIKFGLDDFTTEMPNWTKHHREISLRVKRVKPNGEVVVAESKKIQELMAKHEDLLRPKAVSFFNETSRELENGTDYFLPLKNLEYQETNLDYYSVGAMNTKQTTYMRMTFLLEYDRAVLEHKYDSSGSFAMSFKDFISGFDPVEEFIEEILDEGLPLEETGIARDEDDTDSYTLMVVTPEGDAIDAEINKRELLGSLVGIEVYKFDHEITD